MFASDRMICHYADDTTFYISNHLHKEILTKLESDTTIVIEMVSGQIYESKWRKTPLDGFQ